MKIGMPWNENVFLILCGALFLIIFSISYAFIDPHLFEYRDDGVITMSVGRNIVDYGFAGVSPSGPIVEASSSPLQTIVYAIAYQLTRVHYSVYSWMQTLIATVVTGLIVGKFFVENQKLGVVLATGCAVSLTLFYPFFLWHGSGMENALAHVLYLLSLYLFYIQVKNEQIRLWYALPIFLTSLVRIEAIVHVAVMLIFFSGYWWFVFRNFKAVLLAAVVMLLWCCFQIFRYAYFGDILPNTAYAQSISVGDQLHKLLRLDLAHISATAKTMAIVFIRQGWWIVLIFLPLYFKTRRDRSTTYLISAIFVLAISIVCSPVLFGSPRIDPPRTTTQLTLLLVFSLCFVLFHAKSVRNSALDFAKLLPTFMVVYVIVFGLPKFLGWSEIGLGPYYLGWSTKEFNAVRQKFEKIASEHQIARATVANADLGAMTWYKQFNVVDLGMIGTPEMAKLKNSPLVSSYFLKIALPDIIESHGSWTENYCHSIFLTESFNSQYEMLDQVSDIEVLCKSENPPKRFWIRKDIKLSANTMERKFLNDLQSNLTTRRIEEEITRCKSPTSDCAYIARNVYRFVPELRQRGIYTETLALFQDPADIAFISGWENAQAHRLVMQAAGR